MNFKPCMCVTEPPPGGICNACGAWGVGYAPPFAAPAPPPPNAPQPFVWPPAVPFMPVPLTADEVRKIVREELERALTQGKKGDGT